MWPRQRWTRRSMTCCWLVRGAPCQVSGFFIFFKPAALWQKPLKLACLLHSWTAPLQGQATSPATDSCSLLVLCDIQCRGSPLACLSFWQLLLLHS